jgi:hypothetical protein
MRVALAALTAALLLAGCDRSEVIEASGAAPPRSPTAIASEPHGDLVCDPATQASIDETIRGQLQAFAAGDYAAALAFATEEFRAGNTPEQFEATITQQYPLLIGAEGHASTVCVVFDDLAQVLVSIDAAGDATDELVYDLSREGDVWRIATAGHVRSEQPIEV